MKKKSLKILLAGGGTGGHISPAIAIAQELLKNGHEPVLVTLEKNKYYPPFKILSKKIPIIFYRAPLIPKSPKAIINFFKDLVYSWKILGQIKKEGKPDAVIAFGGYPVFPAIKWAILNKIPVFLHEQNSKEGLITRLFKPFARYVFHSFPQKKFKKNEILTGNPLRDAFLSYKKPKKAAGNKIKKILITGGSQGAKDLNKLYLNMTKDPFFKNIQFTISTGEKNYSELKNKGRKTDTIKDFITDMPEELNNHDLIFCRSGSGSVYESLWSLKPVIFFPYPFATDNHQAVNALAVCKNPDDKFYSLIDIRPFNADKAKMEIINTINALEKRKIKISGESRFLPLNAHKEITRLVEESI